MVLSVRDLRAPGVNGVSFDLRAGEILGLAGLVGAGRSEVARAIYRANRVSSGTVAVARSRGTAPVPVTGDPRAAMRAGVLMIPESRKEQGLMLGRSVTENVSLASLAQFAAAGLVRTGPERRTVRDMLTRVDVRGGEPGGPGRRAVRRQPAEAAVRPVAAARPAGADRRRAHPRRGRRRQAGDL